jgi:hypothetical protein
MSNTLVDGLILFSVAVGTVLAIFGLLLGVCRLLERRPVPPPFRHCRRAQGYYRPAPSDEPVKWSVGARLDALETTVGELCKAMHGVKDLLAKVADEQPTLTPELRDDRL